MLHFYDETRIEVRSTEAEAMAALDPLAPKADRAKAKDQAHPHDDDIDVEKNLRILKECLSLIKPQQLIEDGQTYRLWLRVGFVAYHSTDGDPRALALGTPGPRRTKLITRIACASRNGRPWRRSASR
jgi:hypothetical protein